MEYIVYWYKLQEHSNSATEGYIGITKNIVKRHKAHMYLAKTTSKPTHFTNAINCYGEASLELIVLHICQSKEEAKILEEAYRPVKNIGWNSAPGGVVPECAVKKPIVLYHKSNPDVEYSYSSIINASTSLDLSYNRLRQAYLRKNNTYGYDGWAILHTITQSKEATVDIREVLSAKATQIMKGKPSKYKGVTNRWTEEQKAKIGSYHKGKTIPEKQIQQLTEHNRLNSPSCKQVTLVHISNLQKVYQYHSISEASRQLNIPLSRLKSKAQRPLGNYGKDGWAIQSLG